MIKWIIECDKDGCGKQEPVGNAGMPEHWVLFNQNSDPKHYCSVECLAGDTHRLSVAEINAREAKKQVGTIVGAFQELGNALADWTGTFRRAFKGGD